MANDDGRSVSLGEKILSWFDGKPPSGLLGVVWNEDANGAAVKLNLKCDRWTPWEGGGEYETCFDTDHPVDVYGGRALVRLFQREGGLKGLSLRFPNCAAMRASLTSAVRAELHITTGEGNPYRIYADGSVVRLDYDSGDDTCRLTVTGPEFGKALAAYMMRTGLGGLSTGLGPR